LKISESSSNGSYRNTDEFATSVVVLHYYINASLILGIAFNNKTGFPMVWHLMIERFFV
jgi:hypothetical protein